MLKNKHSVKFTVKYLFGLPMSKMLCNLYALSCNTSYKYFTIVINNSTQSNIQGKFLVRCNSIVTNYDRRGFIRLSTSKGSPPPHLRHPDYVTRQCDNNYQFQLQKGAADGHRVCQTKPSFRPAGQCYKQCDQIGRFLKLIVDKISYKSCSNVCHFFE